MCDNKELIFLPETFWTNPQYRVTVTDIDDDDDDDDDLSTVIVGLMQKGRRKLRNQGKDNISIGYSIYKVSGGGCQVDVEYFGRSSGEVMHKRFI